MPAGTEAALARSLTTAVESAIRILSHPKRSESMNARTEKRGGRTVDPMIGFRAGPVLRASIVEWAEDQSDRPSLPEATRRLVELGLAAQANDRESKEGQRRRAREIAGDTIDAMNDSTATADDQASRKVRLLKGPEEFRDVRVDRQKSKPK
jgi:hypothetical protein